jgi:glutamate---cysteine ligase / carboxylate-amine ligase
VKRRYNKSFFSSFLRPNHFSILKMDRRKGENLMPPLTPENRGSFTRNARNTSSNFTLGIEEEFQMVERETGQLSPRIHDILPKAVPLLGKHVKAEVQQSTIELVSDVMPNVSVARRHVGELRAQLAQILADEGLALISAGTHPYALWQEQKTTENERYADLEEEFQDASRSILVYGLHIHVGIENPELAIAVMNQVRTWLPHLLALSTNSPFWAGRLTGIKSYRSVVWRRIFRSGIPEIFPSRHAFEHYVERLIRAGHIDDGRRVWWDVRPHALYPTLEFRICDMPATLDDTIALAALCQALVAKLAWLHRHHMTTHVLPRYFIEEHKWHASRYGLEARVFDFVQERHMTMRESINELLDLVDDVLDDLGCRREILYLRTLLSSPSGTGADRQMNLYRQTGNFNDVTRYLIQQTMRGINPPVVVPATAPLPILSTQPIVSAVPALPQLD